MPSHPSFPRGKQYERLWSCCRLSLDTCFATLQGAALSPIPDIFDETGRNGADGQQRAEDTLPRTMDPSYSFQSIVPSSRDDNCGTTPGSSGSVIVLSLGVGQANLAAFLNADESSPFRCPSHYTPALGKSYRPTDQGFRLLRWNLC